MFVQYVVALQLGCLAFFFYAFLCWRTSRKVCCMMIFMARVLTLMTAIHKSDRISSLNYVNYLSAH